MIRVVVLGSGASIPSVERNLPAIAIRYGGDVFLFDCGEGTQRQMMKFKVSYSRVKAIFITHLHADHFIGIVGLVRTLELGGRTEPLYIFGPSGTTRMMRAFGAIRGFVKTEDINEKFCFAGEGFVVSAFKTEHGIESYGYVFKENDRRNFYEERAKGMGIKGRMFSELQEKGAIKVEGRVVRIEDVTYIKKGKKIAYTGDTIFSESTVKASQEADILMHDASFSDDMKEEALSRMHSTATDAARVALLANVKKLVLVHISPRYGDGKILEEEAKRIFQNTLVAQDGTEITLTSHGK
ncbi:MAG: ribonuclease Z [Candidatus Micrarchaeia archaeon]